ncbi:MAG: hypothetical protein OEY44_04745 [Candidatus Peregrinibacteria bacterium]|nr:hypothetical protein [Candidatus Peregrinibacteria bacterium]
MFGGIETNEAPSADDILDELTPDADQLSGREKMKVEQGKTVDMAKEDNPDHTSVNPKSYKDIVSTIVSNQGEPQKGDSFGHTEKTYDPDTGKMVETHYVYGKDLKTGKPYMLKGPEKKRDATNSEKAEFESNIEVDAYAEENLRNPKQLKKAEGEALVKAIAKAGGDKLRKDGDTLLYAASDLSGAGVKIPGGARAMYAVRLKGKNYVFTGSGIKG